MANKTKLRYAARSRRKMHIRKVVNGSAERPRMVIFRSLKHMRVSLVDDVKGVTITGLMDSKLQEGQYALPEKADKFKVKGKKLPLTGKVGIAYRLGQAMADVAKERGITKVVFDRNGLNYHGRVRAVAEGARKGGLKL